MHITVYTPQMLWFCDFKQNGTPFAWKSGSDPKTGTLSVWPGKKSTSLRVRDVPLFMHVAGYFEALLETLT